MTAPIRRSAEGWNALLAALPEAMRAEVATAYAGPARHYHDGEHVGGIWATWLALGGDAGDRAILWAAAYHDLIYDIPAPKGRNRRNWPGSWPGSVPPCGWTRWCWTRPSARRGHRRPSAATAPQNRLFCDLDLAGLACDPAGFASNVARSRRNQRWSAASHRPSRLPGRAAGETGHLPVRPGAGLVGGGGARKYPPRGYRKARMIRPQSSIASSWPGTICTVNSV